MHELLERIQKGKEQLQKINESQKSSEIKVSVSSDSKKTEKLETELTKDRWTFEEFFHVFMAVMGLLIVLFIFLSPKKSASGNTRIDEFMDTVWLLLITPTVLVMLYWAFRPMFNGIFWFLANLAIFFWRLIRRSLKFIIRSIFATPSVLKRIEQWSRER